MKHTPRRNPFIAAAVAGLLAAPLATARADEPTKEVQPAPSAPVLIDFVLAELPAGATFTRAIEVELLVTIGKDGAVSDAAVVTPVGGGFDEAALAAVRRFRFTPATVGGQAVSARVRYVYRFEPPVAREAPAPLVGGMDGRVLDRDQQTPIVGADVLVLDAEGKEIARTSTDAEGTFSAPGLAPGRYKVKVTAFEYGRAEMSEDVVAGEAISVIYRLDADAPLVDKEEFGATAVIDAPSREITRRRLSGDELSKTAGTRGDALRAVELMPGVARPADGAGEVIVRGSSPWDTGVYLEGSEVPLLYHFGGLTSFAQSNLISSLDLYPGLFSARYGRKMGGVIEVGLRDPRTDRIGAKSDLNLIDNSVLVEGPISETLSFLIAGRRSHMDIWFESVVPAEEVGVDSAPVYWDWQAMLVWKPTAKDRLRLIGYGSHDTMEIFLKEADPHDPMIYGDLGETSAFHRGQLQWKHTYSKDVEHEVSISAGPTTRDLDVGASIHKDDHAVEIAGRAELRAQITPSVRVVAGADITQEWVEFDYQGPIDGQHEGNPDESVSDRPQVDVADELSYFRPAGYLEVGVRPLSKLELIGGVRVDHFPETDQITTDPRLVVRVHASDTLILKTGVGRFHQAPLRGDTVEGYGNPDLEVEEAIQTGAGFDWIAFPGALLGVEGFYKKLDNLVVSPDDGMTFSNDGEGRIYGMELSAKLANGGKFSGFLSYTLSKSERKDSEDSEWRLFDSDQTHILSASGSYQFGGGWSLGSSLRLGTGNPETAVVGSVYDVNQDVYDPVYGEVNGDRADFFHQLDVRVEKSFRLWNNKMAAYLDVQNAYNARIVQGKSWNYDYSDNDPSYGFPILPSLGLRGEL